MASLVRQVPEWHRLLALSWACLVRQTPHLRDQKQTSPSLSCKLTTVPGRGSVQEFSSITPQKYVQEPENRTRLVQCLHGEQKPCVDPESLEPAKVIRSLQDMGFAEAHINSLCSIQPSVHPQQLLDIVSELLLLGLNPEPVFNALKKNPQLLKLSNMQMKRRSSYLRKLGLGEGKLRRVLSVCPEVFTMHQRDIDRVVKVLREKCLFTAQHITDVLHRCPTVLQEDPNELEYKFQPVPLLRSFKFLKNSWIKRRRSLRATHLRRKRRRRRRSYCDTALGCQRSFSYSRSAGELHLDLLKHF
ncbi:transcription termination factor 4, mitochondrial isoform X3 [Mus caroli]|uniref:Transcription termination factor 4, mitochondrial isoform X3 n=1 Tax=Mus caroli TaxID=10089 RepID=A0A6P5PC67_MUSCR|nr:transcription termination factor 4, mitochondrial isoform X3 [Mus caroli]